MMDKQKLISRCHAELWKLGDLTNMTQDETVRQDIEIYRIALAALEAENCAAISADNIMGIMQRQWNEWCDDTGHFPDDFEWKGGNGILSFEQSRWAKRVADDIIAEITPPAANRVPEDITDLIPRAVELAERLVAPGPKACAVSASETHEICDFILMVVKYLAAAPSPSAEGE